MSEAEPPGSAPKIVLSPQLKFAIKLLSTPTSELAAMLETWRIAHPGSLDHLAADELDPYDEIELASAVADERPGFLFADTQPDPLPALAGGPVDVWIFGNPPQVRANGRAFPRLKVITSDRDARGEALLVIRGLRQRAKTFEHVVRNVLELRPQLATAIEPTKLAPVRVRAISVAAGLHESTIERVTSACRFQTLHGAFRFEAVDGMLAIQPG